MKWLYSQFRLVLPRHAVIDACVFLGGGLLLILECVYAAVLPLRLNQAHARLVWNVTATWENVGIIMIFGAAVGYGIVRAILFYPSIAVNNEYRKWLAIAPYTGVEPLPQGPVHLVWQDLLVVVPLTALGVWHLGWNGVYVPCVVLGIYLVLCLSFLIETGPYLWFYVSVFALTVALYFAQQPAVFLAVLLIAYAAASLAFRPSLLRIVSIEERDIPSYADPKRLFYQNMYNRERPNHTNTPMLEAMQQVGWPWASLRPSPLPRMIPFAHALALSVLAGCFFWVCNIRMDPVGMNRSESSFWPLAIVATVGLFRLVIYLNHNHAPISVFGRIATGRLIIPSYDRVFVAPLVAIGIAYVIPRLPLYGPFWMATLNGVAVALGLLCLLAMGPRYGHWELTGDRRIAVRIFGKQQLYKKI